MAVKCQRSIRGNKVNYRELVQCRLPCSRRVKSKAGNGLYPIKIVSDAEQRSSDRAGRVKAHYIGYSEHYDEWRDIEDIEDVAGDDQVTRPVNLHIYAPYSLY